MKSILKKFFQPFPASFWNKKWVNIEKEIPVLTRPTQQQFNHFQKTGQPVIIKDELSTSKAVTEWNSDYLRQQIGHHEVEVYVSTDGKFPGYEGPLDIHGKGVVLMTINEFLDRILQIANHLPIFAKNEKYYIFHAPESIYAAIKADLPDLQLVKNTQQGRQIQYHQYDKSESHIWISQAGNLTPPHTDTWFENFLVQLHGEKKVLLWDPSQAELLYIMPYGETFARQSPVDLQQADVKRFPNFKNACAISGSLHAGDILFIPEGWIHCVYTETFSISVNYWCKNPEGFNKYFGDLLSYLKQLKPELRAQYLYLLRWPEKFFELMGKV